MATAGQVYGSRVPGPAATPFVPFVRAGANPNPDVQGSQQLPSGPCGAGGWFTLGFGSKADCKAAGGVPPQKQFTPQPTKIYVCGDGKEVSDPALCVPSTPNPPGGGGSFADQLCKTFPVLCGSQPGTGVGVGGGGATGTCPPGFISAGAGGQMICIPEQPASGGGIGTGGTGTGTGTDPFSQLFGQILQSLLSQNATAGGGTGSTSGTPTGSNQQPGTVVIPPAQSSGGSGSALVTLAAVVGLAGAGLWIYKHRHKLFKKE